MQEYWDLYDKAGNLIGKQVVRGQELMIGEYHLVVSAIIKNSHDEYLISRRSLLKNGAGMLETVGGAATTGEDSQKAIIREISEEVGIFAEPHELEFKTRLAFEGHNSYFFDIWLLNKDVEIHQLKLQEEEVSEAMWLPAQKVRDLICQNAFFNAHIYKELIELGLI